jgi:hypothetical protein
VIVFDVLLSTTHSLCVLKEILKSDLRDIFSPQRHLVEFLVMPFFGLSAISSLQQEAIAVIPER